VFEADAADAIGNYVASGDKVAVRHIWRGTARGPEIQLEMTGVYTLRDGKAVEIAFFWDHAEALEAVGLSEQDAHADS
jgi:ketosteroid isomerase-like protein